MKEKIIIYLGSKCNLNCAYCHREIEEDIQINEDFLKSLKDFTGVLIFRGGEPTLYMDSIERFVHSAPNASYCITTNGLLFEKYKNFFERYNFSVFMSFDGNCIRPFDPFIQPIVYDKLFVTSVLTKDDDLFKLLDVFDEKSLIIGHRLEYYPHIGHYTNDDNKKYALCENDYARLSKQIKTCMRTFVDEREKYHFTNRRFYGIHRFFIDSLKNNYIFGETRCANRRTKRVDVSGKRYDCLYIRNNELKDDWLETQRLLIKTQFPKCFGCSVYDMCGGGCIKSLYHDRECKFYYDLFSWYKNFYEENKNFLYD